eukprot:CAMPEP_0197183628 /NCGR_PEP_ID=MMETSP1423-20130617/7922_1 /TAXON_ID=476441 /ORGANISM="Pseudo-nitzschia heimii, Strain UNC1101" /LENGTH=105 /DNA_ID=CAMNT_0042634225 /DNA_START=126 /DNA_END=446 /DNA_ORIENTATION=+
MTYSSSSNSGYESSKATSKQADDALLQRLSPEIIAEQERIMKQIEEENARVDQKADFQNKFSPEIIAEQERIMKRIEEEKARGGHMAGMKKMERQELSIRHAVFC